MLAAMTHPRRRLRPEQRRAEILNAALELFAERGYRNASLAAVAEKVGLSQQGVLHYFPSKDALLIEVLKLRDQIDVNVYHGEPVSLDAIARLVEHNVTQPGIVQSFTVLSADSVTEDHPAKPYFTDRYRTVRAQMAQALRQEFGDEPPEGPSHEQAAALIVAIMDGLQLQWLLDPTVDMPATFRAFAALLRRPQTAPPPDTTPPPDAR